MPPNMYTMSFLMHFMLRLMNSRPFQMLFMPFWIYTRAKRDSQIGVKTYGHSGGIMKVHVSIF